MEKLFKVSIAEEDPDAKGEFVLAIRLTGGGVAILLHEGDNADFVVAQLRHLADVIHDGVKLRTLKSIRVISGIGKLKTGGRNESIPSTKR